MSILPGMDSTSKLLFSCLFSLGIGGGVGVLTCTYTVCQAGRMSESPEKKQHVNCLDKSRPSKSIDGSLCPGRRHTVTRHRLGRLSSHVTLDPGGRIQSEPNTPSDLNPGPRTPDHAEHLH